MGLPAEDRARLADRLWESVSGHKGLEVFMAPELERLLDEGLADLDRAKTIDVLRHRS